MITFSDLLLKFVLPITGLAAGAMSGQTYLSWPGAIAGGLAGFILAIYLGRYLNYIYTLWVARSFQRKWTSFSTSELRSQLATTLTPNFLLLELRRRGEDIDQDVYPILVMLESEAPFRRVLGFAALLSAFPYLAKLLGGYNPAHSVSECHEKVADLRHFIEKTLPHPA
jgi:hypothetical protein